jgi:hypothetical protein
MAVDDCLDAHEAGRALVAARMSIVLDFSLLPTRLYLRQTIPRKWTATEHGTAYHAST